MGVRLARTEPLLLSGGSLKGEELKMGCLASTYGTAAVERWEIEGGRIEDYCDTRGMIQ